jgi:Ni/Fe-hydrogenase subunit HybB-like protein
MVRRIKDVLFVLACLGAVAAVLRLGAGLGATTGLSDEVPWGLWKVLNMIAGVALATGGFVLAFCVHVLRIRSLKPLLRPALLVAFLGYGSSCTALLLDIGLPHRSGIRSSTGTSTRSCSRSSGACCCTSR